MASYQQQLPPPPQPQELTPPPGPPPAMPFVNAETPQNNGPRLNLSELSRATTEQINANLGRDFNTQQQNSAAQPPLQQQNQQKPPAIAPATSQNLQQQEHEDKEAYLKRLKKEYRDTNPQAYKEVKQRLKDFRNSKNHENEWKKKYEEASKNAIPPEESEKFNQYKKHMEEQEKKNKEELDMKRKLIIEQIERDHTSQGKPLDEGVKNFFNMPIDDLKKMGSVIECLTVANNSSKDRLMAKERELQETKNLVRATEEKFQRELREQEERIRRSHTVPQVAPPPPQHGQKRTNETMKTTSQWNPLDLWDRWGNSKNPINNLTYSSGVLPPGHQLPRDASVKEIQDEAQKIDEHLRKKPRVPDYFVHDSSNLLPPPNETPPCLSSIKYDGQPVEKMLSTRPVAINYSHYLDFHSEFNEGLRRQMGGRVPVGIETINYPGIVGYDYSLPSDNNRMLSDDFVSITSARDRVKI